MRPIERRK